MLATDQDSTTVNHRILRGNERDLFRIGQSTGVIQVNAPLNREDVAVFNLVIIADDGLNNGTTLVRIIVTDVNDERPVFQQPAYTATINENSLEGTPVLPSLNGSTIPIQAVDADQPDTLNSLVSYTLSGPNAVLFNIDFSSGIVTVARGECFPHQLLSKGCAVQPTCAVVLTAYLATYVRT